MATSSLVPSRAHPDDDQAAQPVFVQADVEVHPVGPHVHVVPVGQVAADEGLAARPATATVSRVITDADSPAADPKNSVQRRRRSRRVDMPCRYSNGSTSATFGLLRHHGGRIELRNRTRSPVAGSTRRSFTRGAAHLDRARPRRDRARPGVPVAHHQPPAALVHARLPARRCTPSTSASSAAASIRRAPSRTRSHPASTTHLAAAPRRPLPSTSAFLPRRRWHAGDPARWFNEEGTPRPQPGGRSTTSGHTSEADARLDFGMQHPGSVDMATAVHLHERAQFLARQYDLAASTSLLPVAGEYSGQVTFLRTRRLTGPSCGNCRPL